MFYRVFFCVLVRFVFFFSLVSCLQQMSLDFLKLHFEIMPLLVYILDF